MPSHYFSIFVDGWAVTFGTVIGTLAVDGWAVTFATVWYQPLFDKGSHKVWHWCCPCWQGAAYHSWTTGM